MESEMTPGRALYHRWCGSSTTDRARYYDSMNPAMRRDWERLGAEVTSSASTEGEAAIERWECPDCGRTVGTDWRGVPYGCPIAPRGPERHRDAELVRYVRPSEGEAVTLARLLKKRRLTATAFRRAIDGYGDIYDLERYRTDVLALADDLAALDAGPGR